METHVMTFLMPPSSGLCVKSFLRCGDIAASPSVLSCFPEDDGLECARLLLARSWTHTLLTARGRFLMLRKKYRFANERFHCLPIIPWRKDWWWGRGTSASPADENLWWLSFDGATAAGNPIVESFWGCLLHRSAFQGNLRWHNL